MISILKNGLLDLPINNRVLIKAYTLNRKVFFACSAVPIFTNLPCLLVLCFHLHIIFITFRYVLAFLVKGIFFKY